MDEQVTWKPHLKLLEILLIILSWPDCLPSACKIPPQIWELGCTALQISSSRREPKRNNLNRTIMSTRSRLLGQVLCVPQAS